MATEVLKEFLVAIGFKVQEDQYKRQRELLAGVEKQLVSNDKAARERDAGEKTRVAAQVLRANETVNSLRIVGLAVAAFATAAGAAVGALASTIKSSIGEFDRLYYISGRSGASVNNLKALGYAFAQTGSSAEAALQAVDNFARARRANPGIDGLLRSYGVNPNGDSSEVLSNALDAITKRHPQYTAQQVGGLLGISPDEVDHWIRYRKEIAEFNKQYKDLQRSFGVNGGEMARASTSISRALGEFSAVIEVLRDKLVSFFLPAIEAVTKGMVELLHYLTDEANVSAFVSYFDKPIAAAKELGRILRYLYDQFVLLFEYVRNSPIGRILGAINPGFFRDALLNMVPGGGSGGEGGGGGAGGDRRNWWQRNMPGFLGGQDAPIPGGTARIGAAARNQNAQTVMSELRRAGYNDNAIAAIVGSMQTESSFNPSARNAVAGGHTGLWQWDRNRWPRVARWITQRGGNPADAAWQTRAWIAEHNARPGDAMYDHSRTQRGGEILRNNPSLEDAIHGVRESERFGAGEEGGRAANARGWLPHVRGARQAPAPANGEAPTAATTPATPAQPRMNMSPGGFNVNDYLRTAPMGANSTASTSNRTVNQNNPVTVNVQGATDPQATGAAVARGVSQANDMSLRNVQTAVR